MHDYRYDREYRRTARGNDVGPGLRCGCPQPGIGGNIVAGLRSIVGGEIHEYTQLLEEARRHAVDRLVANATAMGANAVIMMRFDSGDIGQTMNEVIAYGTAVVIEPA